MGKLTKMIRFLPGLYNPSANPNVRGLLYAWASEDDNLVQSVTDAKEQVFVKKAQSQFLDALGSNVGVFRPTEFNLLDEQYRELIPILSYKPKQVIPTIKDVLRIFWGTDPRVQVYETFPNEIVVQIPSSVRALRRTLIGSQHFHSYNMTISAIDNFAKDMTIDLIDSTKALVVDELANAAFGQGNFSELIASNTAGTTGVTLQFFASADLSVFSTTENANIAVPDYPGSFMPDPTAAFSVTSQRGILGQSITAGTINPTITMTDASGIPDTVGLVAFNYGRQGEEAQVKYFGRPNNSTLLLDPSYVFINDHSPGEAVNVIVTPYQDPSVNGQDYSVYLVGITAARILAQELVRSIVAAGVVVRFILIEPEIRC